MSEINELQQAIDERDIELAMLRKALDTIPLHEYGEWCIRKRKGARAMNRTDSVWTELQAAVDKIDILEQQLATVTALVPNPEWVELAGATVSGARNLAARIRDWRKGQEQQP